jgi:lipopolysaccharide/colanic/teichoic acid biosynthesis glycosyltransferase
VGKRILDLALGGFLIVLLAPLIAIVALAVLVTSGWPVFYGSERIGLDGRKFQMWKFRTMVRGARRRRGLRALEGNAPGARATTAHPLEDRERSARDGARSLPP